MSEGLTQKVMVSAKNRPDLRKLLVRALLPLPLRPPQCADGAEGGTNAPPTG